MIIESTYIKHINNPEGVELALPPLRGCEKEIANCCSISISAFQACKIFEAVVFYASNLSLVNKSIVIR